MAVLTLQYADGFDETKSMNTTGQFSVVLSSDGISYDLSQAKDIAIKVGNAKGYVTDIPVDLDSIDDKSQGTINIKLDDNFMAEFPPDVYYIEVWINTDQGRVIFPSEGVLPFTIDRNIMSNIDGVAKITMYQFQNNFNDLKKMIMDNQAFLDTKLRQELEDQTNIKNDFANITDTKQKNFDTDLANARQNIEDKKNDAHSYVDKINSDSTNDIQKKTTDSKNYIDTQTNNAKSYIDDQTKQTKDYIDNAASNNTNSINQTANDAKNDVNKFNQDSKNDINSTKDSAKSDLTAFSKARQDEINNRINELNNTITNQQNQYKQNIDNMNNDVNNHKASYDNLHDETQSLLNQLKNNEGSVHASVADINNVRNEAKQDAQNMQTNIDNAHDQAIQQSSQYTDSKYNDLNNKNNILSQKMEDYQKPNLLNLNFNGVLDVGANQYNYLGTVHLAAGKDYKFSMDLKHPYKNIDRNNNTWVDGNNWTNSNDFHVFLKDSKGNWAFNTGNLSYYNSPDYKILSYDVHINNTNDYVLEYDNYYAWLSGNAYLRGAWITETTDVIPFDVAEQNKASIESEGQFTTSQAPNIAPQTETNYTGYGWYPLIHFDVEQGKKYYISAYDYTQTGWCLETNLTNSTPNMTDTNFFVTSFTADKTENLPLVAYNYDGNGGNLTKMCITQSDEYVPYEVAQKNKLWNSKIDDKTNDLSNKIDDTNNNFNDKINSTKPHNLAPYYETSWDTWFTTHWGDPNSQVPVEKGKTYWFSCYVCNGKVNISSSEGPNSQDASKTFALQPDYYTGNYYANWGQYFICKWVSDRDGNLPLSFNSPNQNEHRRVTKICVTQSENYIPYEETDSDTSVNELAPIDYVDNQISTKIDNGVNKSIQQSNENITKVSNNKVADNHDGTIQINGKNQSISKGINKCDLNNITTPGTYFSSGIDDIQDYINAPTIYNKTSKVNNMYFVLTVYKADDMCFTQVIKSGDFKPYYRNRASDGWSQWYQLADTDYVDNQIASIKANAWRELEIDGNILGGIVTCKIDRSSNTAILCGYINIPNGNITITIKPSDDFEFLSPNGIYCPTYQPNNTPINGTQILTSDNGNLLIQPGKWNDGEQLSLFDVSTSMYKILRLPIQPK